MDLLEWCMLIYSCLKEFLKDNVSLTSSKIFITVVKEAAMLNHLGKHP